MSEMKLAHPLGWGDVSFAAGEMIIDGQLGYDISTGMLKGVSLYVQGQNLTNEPFTTINGTNTNEIIDYQKYGRRFLAGATFKF